MVGGREGGREREHKEVRGAALLEPDVYGWCCIAPFSRRKRPSSQLQTTAARAKYSGRETLMQKEREREREWYYKRLIQKATFQE